MLSNTSSTSHTPPTSSSTIYTSALVLFPLLSFSVLQSMHCDRHTIMMEIMYALGRFLLFLALWAFVVIPKGFEQMLSSFQRYGARPHNLTDAEFTQTRFECGDLFASSIHPSHFSTSRGFLTFPGSPTTETVILSSATSTTLARKMSQNCITSVRCSPAAAATLSITSSRSTRFEFVISSTYRTFTSFDSCLVKLFYIHPSHTTSHIFNHPTLTIVAAEPLATMVNSARSLFSPTASDSILDPTCRHVGRLTPGN